MICIGDKVIKYINQRVVGGEKEDCVYRGQIMEGLKIQTEELGTYIINHKSSFLVLGWRSW